MYIPIISLGGPTPYVPINVNDNNTAGGGGGGGNKQNRSPSDDQMKRARVLCSYDANDHTELNLTANEVISVFI